MTYKILGNTTIEWDDTAPFLFNMLEVTGPPEDRRSNSIRIDLSGLRQGLEDEFILHFKDHLIGRRTRVGLKSIKADSDDLCILFHKVIDLNLFNRKISIVDEAFLLALGSVRHCIPERYLMYLKKVFSLNSHSPIFSTGLSESDFPRNIDIKGRHGRQIDRILAKALTRSACVQILSRCEQAFDKCEMEICHFAFANLAFAVFCRPDSYRQITISDLIFDTETNSHFIYIVPVKTRIHHPNKICYQINEPVGIVLQKQRQHVIARYGHLVESTDIGKLALFPSRRLKTDKSKWTSRYPNANYGMFNSSGNFMKSYPKAIQKLFQDSKFTLSANTLRHTVGTQLALSGASARTIQAVLKHASDTVCQAYVDIAFEGLINELSDAMEPSFQRHLPVFERFRSIHDSIPAEKAIHSENIENGEIALTGECGKQIQCEHAPIVCYGCHRFIPCWDADHSVNLDTVQKEIDDFKKMGMPFAHLIQKAQEAKYRIILVMNSADRYQQAMATAVSK